MASRSLERREYILGDGNTSRDNGYVVGVFSCVCIFNYISQMDIGLEIDLLFSSFLELVN
jgi:hypothetical protein